MGVVQVDEAILLLERWCSILESSPLCRSRASSKSRVSESACNNGVHQYTRVSHSLPRGFVWCMCVCLSVCTRTHRAAKRVGPVSHGWLAHGCGTATTTTTTTTSVLFLPCKQTSKTTQNNNKKNVRQHNLGCVQRGFFPLLSAVCERPHKSFLLSFLLSFLPLPFPNKLQIKSNHGSQAW